MQRRVCDRERETAIGEKTKTCGHRYDRGCGRNERVVSRPFHTAFDNALSSEACCIYGCFSCANIQADDYNCATGIADLV